MADGRGRLCVCGPIEPRDTPSTSSGEINAPSSPESSGSPTMRTPSVAPLTALLLAVLSATCASPPAASPFDAGTTPDAGPTVTRNPNRRRVYVQPRLPGRLPPGPMPHRERRRPRGRERAGRRLHRAGVQRHLVRDGSRLRATRSQHGRDEQLLRRVPDGVRLPHRLRLRHERRRRGLRFRSRWRATAARAFRPPDPARARPTAARGSTAATAHASRSAPARASPAPRAAPAAAPPSAPAVSARPAPRAAASAPPRRTAAAASPASPAAAPPRQTAGRRWPRAT